MRKIRLVRGASGRVAVALVAAALLAPASSSAATTAAPPPSADLQGTLDAATRDTTVRVPAGVHQGPIRLDLGRSLIATPGGPAPVITAECATPAITVPAGAGAPRIEGLRIVSLCPNGTQTGIAVHGASAPVITDNVIEGFAVGIAVGQPGDAGAATPLINGNEIVGTHGAGLSPGVGVAVSGNANPALRSNRIIDPRGDGTIGVNIAPGPAAVLPGGADLVGNQITGHAVGLQVLGARNPVTMFNDLVSRSSETGLRAGAGSLMSPAASVHATNVDIVDTLAPNPEVELAGATLRLDSSIIGAGGITSTQPAAACEISYSIGPAGSPGPSGCSGPDFQSNADPGFADPAGSDYSLQSDSPAIDAGNPAPSGGLIDLLGAPRQTDGDADGEQRRDVGAAESRPQAAQAAAGNSPPNAITYAVKKGGWLYLGITSDTNVGTYLLCITGPGGNQCRSFRMEREGSQYHDNINWSKSFPYRGPGNYRASWLAYSGGPQLGPQRPFTWGHCPPLNLTMAGVWKPKRLIVRNRCQTIKGKVKNSFISRDDNDIHVRFIPSSSNVKTLEILPRDRPNDLPRPQGRRVKVTGVYVCDTFHGPRGHTEIHPVFRYQYISSSGRVQRTFTGGPHNPGTPRVNQKQKGRFHCR